jgi:aerobic carbon-monoxide dehydrogenase large subunit
VLRAAEATRDKALRVAAELLEAAVDDLVLSGARVHVKGSSGAGIELGEIAAACDAVSSRERGDEPGLGAREIYVDPMMNYPYGVALCQLELDPSTGAVEVGRYFVAYEVGRAVNPALVRGQIVGGAVQGLGGALFEELAYDAGGQLVAGSFMDYLLPTACEVPDIEVLVTEDAPTPLNPLGAKGAGEGGAAAVGAAIANAVSDAVGAEALSLPLTPERVMRLARSMTIPREGEQ